MSLWIEFVNPVKAELEADSFEREEDSFDPDGLAGINITHNLGRLATHIAVDEVYTLYDVLWHGNTLDNPIKHGRDFIPYLTGVCDCLKKHKTFLSKYSSPNGWGTYEDFYTFVENCLKYAHKYPDAEIVFCI